MGGLDNQKNQFDNNQTNSAWNQAQQLPQSFSDPNNSRENKLETQKGDRIIKKHLLLGFFSSSLILLIVGLSWWNHKKILGYPFGFFTLIWILDIILIATISIIIVGRDRNKIHLKSFGKGALIPEIIFIVMFIVFVSYSVFIAYMFGCALGGC